MASTRLLGRGLIEAIATAQGIDPARVQRIVVDACYDDVAIVYVKLIGSTKLLEVNWADVDVRVEVT